MHLQNCSTLVWSSCPWRIACVSRQHPAWETSWPFPLYIIICRARNSHCDFHTLSLGSTHAEPGILHVFFHVLCHAYEAKYENNTGKHLALHVSDPACDQSVITDRKLSINIISFTSVLFIIVVNDGKKPKNLGLSLCSQRYHPMREVFLDASEMHKLTHIWAHSPSIHFFVVNIWYQNKKCVHMHK